MDEDTSSSDADGVSEEVASRNEFLEVFQNHCLSELKDFQNCVWQSEIAHQRELIEELQTKVEFYKKMDLEKKKTCEDKELEIKTLKDTIKELKKTPNSTSNYGKERLKELEMDISKLEIENVDLTENKRLLEGELHQMKTENVQLREHVQKMKQESNGGSSELLKKLQEDMSRLKTQIEKLNNDKMALERKLHSYEAEKDKLKEKAGKSSTPYDKGSNDEKLEKEVSRIQKWNQMLIAENNRLQNGARKLEKILENNMDYDLMRSLFTEAISTDESTPKMNVVASMADEIDTLKLENQKLKLSLQKEQNTKRSKKGNVQDDVTRQNDFLHDELLKTHQMLHVEKLRSNKAEFTRFMASIAVKDNEKLKSQVSSLKKFEAQIIQKNKEIKSINGKLQAIKSENENLVKEINILKTTKAEETSLPAGSDQSIILQETVKNLKEELEKLKMENLLLTKELKKQVQILEEEKSLAQDEKRELKNKIADLNEEMMSAFRQVSVESYKNEIRDLSDENNELRKANKEISDFLTKHGKENVILKIQIQRMAEVLENETSKFQNQIKSLTDEKAKLNKTIEKIKSENKTLKDQKSKADVEKINQQLRNDNQKLSLRLEMAKEDKVELENNFKKLQEEKMKIETKLELNMEEISKLQNQIKTLQDKIENSEDYAKLQGMSEKISKLESQLEILQKADENLKLVQTQNAEFEIKIQVYENENKTLEDKVNVLKTEGKKLLETLKSDKQKLKHEKIQLQTEIVNLKLKVENLQGQLEREVNDISVQTSDEFMEEFTSLHEQVAVHETEIENLNDQLKTYITVSQIKQDEVETLDKEFKSKEIETNSLKDDLEGMNLRNTIAQAQLDKVKSNLETWILTFNNQIEAANMYTFRQSLNWMAPILSGMNNVKEDVEKSSKFNEKIKRYKLRHYHDIIRELMEAELSCSICSDTMKNAVTLQCSHTFCEGCLELWKRTKWECPMCRARVEVQSKTPLIDNVIEKMMACFPKQNYEEIAEEVYNDDFPPLNIS